VSKLRSKTEVYFTSELDEKLELLQRDLSSQVGKRISKSVVVNEIVSHFFRISPLMKEVLPTKSSNVVEDVPHRE
jgi:hypothetical protein